MALNGSRFLLLFAIAGFFNTCFSYNTPGSLTWPEESEWIALGMSLSSDASLSGPIQPKPVARQCRQLALRPFETLTGGGGLCMQTTKCIYEFCDESRGFAFPAYVADVRTDNDIVSVLQFSERHNISVSIKSTGHSYHGASLVAGSILIFLRNFPRNDTIVDNFVDSCGTNHGNAIAVAAGEIFNDVYSAVGNDYFVVGGAGTVSLPGGWVQGSGLSYSSRQFGLGVDQVLNFRVVLASGDIMTVDACSEPDLFWALRGGGGGTFGVVTQITYNLHPPTPVTTVSFNIQAGFFPSFLLRYSQGVGRFMEQFFEYWIEVAPTLDTRWGGLFGGGNFILTFLGTIDEARETFLNDFDRWFDNVLEKPILLRLLFLSKPQVTQFDGAFDAANSLNLGPLEIILEARRDARAERRGARLVPASIVQTKPNELKDLLVTLAKTGTHGASYFLGGRINSTLDNATAVHPALRQAQFSIFTYGDEANEMVRQLVPNDITGACFNHHYYLEPDWRNALWGSNYDRLSILKERYDPNHRFNPWHSVGYVGEEPELAGDNQSTLLDVLFWFLGLRFPFF